MSETKIIDLMEALKEALKTSGSQPAQPALAIENNTGVEVRVVPADEEQPEHGMGFGLLTEQLIEEGLIDPPKVPSWALTPEEAQAIDRAVRRLCKPGSMDEPIVDRDPGDEG